MRTARKLFFFFLAFFAFSILLLKPASAQSYTTLNTDPDVPQNLHTYAQNQLIDTLSAFICQIAGVDPTTKDGRCLGVNPETGKVGYVNTNGGAIGFTSNLIAMTFNIPFHTSDYVRYLAGNFGIVKPVVAATSTGGEGFSSLQNLLPVWVSFRDITYLVFVLVFIVIGIAIMLRVKIDPRTVMTIQNQIPKIIIGLILVTFSFAIAAFLIDLMWIFIYFLFSVFSNIDKQGIGQSISFINNVQVPAPSYFTSTMGFFSIPAAASKSIGGIMVAILGGDNNPVGSIIVSVIGGFIGGFIGNFASPMGGIIGAVAGAALTDVFKNTILNSVGILLGFIIILVALLVAMFRLWFSLLQSYVMVLIDILLAPFWIIAGLLPGRSIGFGAWIKDLGANLFAFPTVFLMFLLGKTIIDLMPTGSTQFVPPFVGNPAAADSLKGLIGLGIILLTPNAVNFTKAIFKAPKMDISPVMQTIGGATGILTNTVKQTAGSIFAYKKGTMPQQGEHGTGAVARRIFGRL